MCRRNNGNHSTAVFSVRGSGLGGEVASLECYEIRTAASQYAREISPAAPARRALGSGPKLKPKLQQGHVPQYDSLDYPDSRVGRMREKSIVKTHSNDMS